MDECPVEAITLNEMNKAQIDEESCIRCAKCHDVCPEEAVRHDSEKIPQQVEENLEKTRKLLEYYEKTAPKLNCVPKFKSDAKIGKISRFCSGII
jgi:Fe-S-cluster-containing hydrogenase component 2